MTKKENSMTAEEEWELFKKELKEKGVILRKPLPPTKSRTQKVRYL